MKELNDLLKSPFDGLKQDDVAGIQNRGFKIAKTLFENYSVACGDKVYRFAEIEFYYYKKSSSHNCLLMLAIIPYDVTASLILT